MFLVVLLARDFIAVVKFESYVELELYALAIGIVITYIADEFKYVVVSVYVCVCVKVGQMHFTCFCITTLVRGRL